MLILASQSASRTEMLSAAGVPFTAEPAHADEAAVKEASPKVVERPSWEDHGSHSSASGSAASGCCAQRGCRAGSRAGEGASPQAFPVAWSPAPGHSGSR